MSDIQWARKWQKEIKDEDRLAITKIFDNGWVILQREKGWHRYRGVVGVHNVGENGFFAVYDPQAQCEYYIRLHLIDEAESKCFTDGRELRWMAREFLPPEPRKWVLSRLTQVVSITNKEIKMIEHLRNKVLPYTRYGTPERKQALALAKKNRKEIRKKYGPVRKPKSPDMPDEVRQTLELLNGGPIKK